MGPLADDAPSDAAHIVDAADDRADVVDAAGDRSGDATTGDGGTPEACVASADAAGCSAPSLTTALIAFWKLEETNGERNDAVGANHLTESGVVTQVPGMVGNAAQFSAARTAYLAHGDNAELSVGGTDFSISLWVRLDSKTESRTFVSKAGASPSYSQLAYHVGYALGADRFSFTVGNGSSATSVLANNLGPPVTDVFYHLVAIYDSTHRKLSLGVNALVGDSVTAFHDSYDSVGPFYIGGQPGYYFHDGAIDAVGFWKRALSYDDVKALHNATRGIEFPFGK
jgi:hypothetical protein